MFTGDVTLSAEHLHGRRAHVAWSYHTAAECTRWKVARSPQGYWTLSAQVTRADPFVMRQKGLQFLAPRVGGFFVWPILALALQPPTLTATLGPPEN